MSLSKTPRGNKLVQGRFAVIYVVEWMGSPLERYFSTLGVALNFAGRITTDGTTTYPGVASPFYSLDRSVAGAGMLT
jgi:hypothetical protein